ncbi:MAG: hybrid sensor histidine kinase/response regulator [Pseudomonadota bacterium]
MAFDRAKFLKRFITEARELLQNIDAGLVALEGDPDETESITELFRSAHTLKGSSRMMKLMPISELSHYVEDVFGAIRSGDLTLSESVVDVLFEAVDKISELVELAEAEMPLDDPESALIERLQAAANGQLDSVGSSPQVEGGGEATGEKAKATDGQAASTPPLHEENRQTPTEHRENSAVPPSELAGEATVEARQQTHTVSQRVDASTIDELLAAVGELMSFHGRLLHRVKQVRQLERRLGDSNGGDSGTRRGESKAPPEALGYFRRISPGLQADAELLGILLHRLQENTLAIRMVPISELFELVPRMVRDASRSLDKKVKLTMEGGETRLDKAIVEGLSAPLVHLIRNAIDHGIEDAATRQEQGKPPEGRLHLSARTERGSILIELTDDGRGISLENIRKKAQEKGVSGSQLERMSRDELLQYIFHPGFSTREFITDYSGRGVGLDVVRKQIFDELKGRIDIHTVEGEGSTFLIRLPPTLVTVIVLFFKIAADNVFGLPASGVREILRTSRSQLIDVGKRRAIRVREEVIPIVNGARLMGLDTDGGEPETITVLLVRDGEDTFALTIDEVLEEEVVVLKPVPPLMINSRFVSGVVNSGHFGTVPLLDGWLLNRAAKSSKLHEVSAPAEEERASEKHLLVVDDSFNTREIEKEILESHGYRVSVAGDGAEGVKIASKTDFDLIVTDIEMPRMDGFSLVKELRKSELHAFTPIIIVSSRDESEARERGMRAGANAYIVKGGFDQSNLVETVQSLIGGA